MQIDPVARIGLIRHAGQPDVQLAAEQALLEAGHGQADGGVVAPGFLFEVNTLPDRVPGLPEAQPGEIVRRCLCPEALSTLPAAGWYLESFMEIGHLRREQGPHGRLHGRRRIAPAPNSEVAGIVCAVDQRGQPLDGQVTV